MSIVFGSTVPHPPLLIPEVGKDNLFYVEKTKEAMEKLAKMAAEEKVETLVVVSPHSLAFADAIAIKTGKKFKGSFIQFGAKSVSLELENDVELVDLIVDYAAEEDVPMFKLNSKFSFKDTEELDHGVLVPLFYLEKYIKLPIVSLSISSLDYYKHYMLGIAIQKAADKLKRRVGFIASGDLSHRLTPEAPAGFSRRGKEFDLIIKNIIEKADFRKLFSLDEDLIDDAGECGLRSIFVLAGSLNGYAVDSNVLSYEGPFGVGYLVSFIKVLEKDLKRDLIEDLAEKNITQREQIKKSESPAVKLAREAVESYVKNKTLILPPDVLPDYMKDEAGVFVSIKKHKALRGCIGTINPAEPNVAEEIIRNAISASSNDPRFDPVDVSELEDLMYSVDILDEPEEIPDKSFLDPLQYGVIVKSGFKTGLLLPNIEGVETVDEQLLIARKKANIDKDEPVKLYRFKVARYH